jgi:hypothetical protein
MTQDPPPFSEVARSPAYAVLRLSTRRALTAITDAIANQGGPAELSHDKFEQQGISRTMIGPALRELAALGFVEISVGAKKKNRFTLCDRWRSVTSLQEAQLISGDARAARPQPSKKPERPGDDDAATRAMLRVATGKATRRAAISRIDNSAVASQTPRPITLPVLNWPTNPSAGE